MFQRNPNETFLVAKRGATRGPIKSQRYVFKPKRVIPNLLQMTNYHGRTTYQRIVFYMRFGDPMDKSSWQARKATGLWNGTSPWSQVGCKCDLGRQTAEGSEQAHPSERHVRHSICPSIIGYIAETCEAEQGGQSQSGRKAPQVPGAKVLQRLEGTYAMNQKIVSPSLWRDLIPPCQAKARRQKKHSKARKERRARLRESMRPEASCMSDALFLWLVQRLDVARISQFQSVPNSCEASFCFAGQKEERVGAGARSAAEACGLRQEKR